MINEYQNRYYSEFIKNINENNLCIGIVGLGYVGLPLALSFCEKNIRVFGIDTKKSLINSLNNSLSYLNHVDSKRIKKVIKSKLLSPTGDFQNIKNVNAIIICVPTPLSKKNYPDLSNILCCLNSMKKYLRKGQILILESTTYPGTTDEILRPFLERLNFKIGENFFLVYSPEREDPGNKLFSNCQIPKIVGGDTKLCSKIGTKLYSKIIPEIVKVSSSRAAEMTKLLENVFRAVNIGMVNELKELTEKLNIDIFEVVKAASSKPFGYIPFYPGPGVGGHCIPIDPHYLSWKAKEYGLETKIIDVAGEINAAMPKYVLKRLGELLEKNSVLIKNSKILILGVTYKKNIDDLRESPALEIIDQLIKMGANVSYCDPYCPELFFEKKYNFKLSSTKLNIENIKTQDCVILITDHDKFDYELVEKNSKLLIDTRGRLSISKKIIRA